MIRYIDKAAVVAEIEKKRDAALTRQRNLEAIGQVTVLNETLARELNRIISFINTIEVKEVDLNEEIDNYISDNFFGSETLGFFANRTKEEPNDQDIALCAKHFFELGIKAQKEE